MREALTTDSKQIALLLMPSADGATRERPSWRASLIVRSTAGRNSVAAGTSSNLEAPYVTWGRLMQPYWLRLERAGQVFTGSISPDGRQWTKVAEVTAPLQPTLRVGLAACSALGSVTTTAMFDHVAAPGWRR